MGFNHQSPAYVEKQRQSHLGAKNSQWGKGENYLGCKNHNWKGGNSYSFFRSQYIPIIKTLKQCCSMCGKTEKLVCHHIDYNPKNNVLENMVIVCRGCHNAIHKRKIK